MRARDLLLIVPCVLLLGCPTGTDDDDDDDPAGPAIDHEPVTDAVEGTEIPIAADVSRATGEEGGGVLVSLNWRVVGGDWEVQVLGDSEDGGTFSGVIPADGVTVTGVEYYLQATEGTLVSTHPAGAPGESHRIVVSAAPLNDPSPVRARYDHASDTVEVTWTAPTSSAFVGYSVTAQLDGGDIESVCEGGEADGACTVPADGVWSEAYATWTVTLAADGQGGTSASAVTDSLHFVVDVFAKEATVEDPTLFGSGELEFFLPSGVAVDAAGTVHVAEQSNHRLQTFTDDGDFLGFVGALGGTGVPGDGSSEFSAPHDVAIAGDGTLWVADHSNARVQAFDGTTRQFEDAFGDLGEGDGQLRFPVSLTFDGDGLLHVAESVNGRVSVFDGTTFVETYAEGDAPFVTPTRVEYLPDLGVVAVSDLDVVHLVPVDEDATAATWDVSPGGTAVVSGLCPVGHGETMLTIDDPTTTTGSTGHKLVRVDAEGAVVTELGEWGVGEGQFWRPIDCAVDGSGNVWVADGLNHRIVVLGP